MCTDLTMSSLLGYFMTMLYNPNNVALEASPMTTLVELRVGQQLCKLFGYNTDVQKSPVSWGHITCDGTIANLESIWVGTYSHSRRGDMEVNKGSTKPQVLSTQPLPCTATWKAPVHWGQVLRHSLFSRNQEDTLQGSQRMGSAEPQLRGYS